MEELIAKRYATALSSASQDVAAVSKVLGALADALLQEEIMTVLNSPVVPSETKTEMILAALGKNADSTLVNFIKILGENKRLNLIPAVAKVLNAELQKAANKYEGVVKSAKKLDKQELDRLEETLGKYTGAKIKLKQEKSDLDGLRVSVDDLGIEVNFSKQRVKEQLIDFIKKSL
jgi:F-type H+-transporting ATPase subunit delta